MTDPDPPARPSVRYYNVCGTITPSPTIKRYVKAAMREHYRLQYERIAIELTDDYWPEEVYP